MTELMLLLTTLWIQDERENKVWTDVLPSSIWDDSVEHLPDISQMEKAE